MTIFQYQVGDHSGEVEAEDTNHALDMLRELVPAATLAEAGRICVERSAEIATLDGSLDGVRMRLLIQVHAEKYKLSLNGAVASVAAACGGSIPQMWRYVREGTPQRMNRNVKAHLLRLAKQYDIEPGVLL